MENVKVVTLTVTEAEQALIEANRQKEAALEVERQAQKKVQDAKKIARMQEQIVTFKQGKTMLDTTYGAFFQNLVYEAGNGVYEHKVTPTTRKFDVSNYSNDGNEVLAVENVPYNEHVIGFVANPLIYVTVVFDDGAYRYCIHGIGYEFSEKYFKRAKTVHDKVIEFVSRKQRLAELLTKKKTMTERLVEKLIAENPDAAVTTDNVTYPHYKYSSHGKRSVESYTEVAIAIVEYPNGLRVSYKAVEENGEVKAAFYVYNANHLSSMDIVNALKLIPKKVV
jgi:hypothetical protein